jgi:hypothetical protein
MKARMVAMEVEIDDKIKTIEILQDTLKQQKEIEKEFIKKRLKIYFLSLRFTFYI